MVWPMSCRTLNVCYTPQNENVSRINVPLGIYMYIVIKAFAINYSDLPLIVCLMTRFDPSARLWKPNKGTSIKNYLHVHAVLRGISMLKT